MQNGYIISALAFDAAHIVLAADGLPPTSIRTADWSQFPMIREPKLLIEGTGTYFLLRVPGDAKGLYRALEEMMDLAGVYREGYWGLDNHRLLLAAVTKIRDGATDRVLVNFTLSPEQMYLDELEFIQREEAVAWSAHLRCLDDPGCAEVFRRGR